MMKILEYISAQLCPIKTILSSIASIFLIAIVHRLYARQRTINNRNDVQTSQEDVDINEVRVRGGVICPNKERMDHQHYFTGIKGPKIREIDFLVSTPPSEHIRVLASSEYKSIYRQLRIDLYQMTLERREPKENDFVPLSSSSPTKKKGDPPLISNKKMSNSSDDDDFRSTSSKSGILPLSHIINTNAHHRCSTLELTMNISDASSDQFLSYLDNPVTMRNWKNHDATTFSESETNDNLNKIPADRTISFTSPKVKNSKQSAAEFHQDICDLANEDLSVTPTTRNAILTKQNKRYHPEQPQRKLNNCQSLVTEEYTFVSESEAAQFQSTLLTLKSVGVAVRNMYIALESLHMCSDAYDGNDIGCSAFGDCSYQSKEDGGRDDRPDADSSTVSDNSCHDLSPEEVSDGSLDKQLQPQRLDQGKKGNIGVALDDVQRCLGEMTFIGRHLSRINEQHYENASTNTQKLPTAKRNLITSAADRKSKAKNHHQSIGLSGREHKKRTNMYKGKRLLLGYVDFFHLFVPQMLVGTPCANPDASKEEKGKEDTRLDILDEFHEKNRMNDHHQRILQLLHIRKLVASASVRVSAYVNAMKVVYKGWKIECGHPDYTFDGPFHQNLDRRLAFDHDALNSEHDMKAENEYYEATVGRDIQTSHDSNPESGDHECSYQAYSLVGCHLFKLPANDDKTKSKKSSPILSSSSDPVMALPSLKKIIDQNPSMEFFVVAIFHERQKIATVSLFVRSLPHSIDNEFDQQLDSFMDHHSQVISEPNSDIELYVQLGPKSRLSMLTLAAMQVKSFASRFSHSIDSLIPYTCLTNERLAFPGVPISHLTTTKYFAGQMNIESSRLNYFALSSHINCSVPNIYPAKILHNYIIENEKTVVDFTFVIGRKNNDSEANCRALGSIRFVHLNTRVAIFLDENEVKNSSTMIALNSDTLSTSDDVKQPESSLIKNQAFDNEVPQEKIDILKEILDNITVPFRLSVAENKDISVVRNQHRISTSNYLQGEIQDIEVLRIFDDNELQRHYIASGSDLKETAIRVVRSAAWRGVTFPIDTRRCRVELQNNQFFRDGVDMCGSPVFYFFNMVRGVWRKDINASKAAILHILNYEFTMLKRVNPTFTCTLIVFMGKPLSCKDSQNSSEQESTYEDRSTSSILGITKKYQSPNRIVHDEDYHIHTNFKLVQQLIDVVSKHYPERLGRALLVPGGGWDTLLGNHGLRRYINSSKTRSKVVVLERLDDLKKYVSDDELITCVGGKKGTVQLKSDS